MTEALVLDIPNFSKIFVVAYKPRLPAEVNMHLVFHVSLLKKSIEPQALASSDLPIVSEEEEGVVDPQAILDNQVIYQGSVPPTQVLVRWSQKDPDHTTWEYLPELLTQFPRPIRLL